MIKIKQIIIISILFISLILQCFGEISNEERNNLFQKMTTKISLDNAEQFKTQQFSRNALEDGIMYDPTIIESILKKYNFPEEYNFFEDTGADIKVKDQGKCGCCWSHASTTALGYRYYKIGVKVDLSPQYPLSCYIKDCDTGNYLIDSQLNLIKNGTVTEGCLPFNSGDGTIIDECPSICKDGSTLKKYYSQNAYMTQNYYSKETFYDIVTIIFDQLNNYGPVVSGIDVYYDFIEFNNDNERCKNEVYTYNGKSLYLGGHAVTIVGYGYMNSKYYWLIQNSWGENACDNGFAKIEFGQIGVEEVAFSEPNLKKNITTPKEIQVKFNSLDGKCNMNVSSYKYINKWVNSLDIGFQNTETCKDFNYQCGPISFFDRKKIVCYFEYNNYFAHKGIYKYEYSQSLGNENNFILDSSFTKQNFKFYGYDAYDYIFSNILYVSQEGSKIFLFYTNFGGDDRFIAPLYANQNSINPLSNCKNITFFDFDFVYCDIKRDEIFYFENINNTRNNPLVYDILCGYKENFSTFVYKLDMNKYPVFKIKKFILPQEKILTIKSKIIGVGDIEGSISGYFTTESIFYVYAYIEIEKHNYTSLVECKISKPRRIMKNYLFSCTFLSDIPEINYDNIYIYPYNIPDLIEYPYEIFIKDVIKAEKYDPNLFVPKIKVYIESLCPDCVNFITKSFKDFIEKVEKPNLVNIEFIPFGNAKEIYNKSTKKYDYICQHGENECYGNLIETCSIRTLGIIESYSIIICIESNIFAFEKNFDKTLEFCLSNYDIKIFKEIKDCANNDLGNLYQHQMAQKTDINHRWVPWIVVDGHHDEKIEKEILESLIDYICGDDKTKCFKS